MTPFKADNLKFVLRGKKILLGITGSIAAFKACDIIRYLRSCDAEVRVVLTRGAENFVTRTTLETLSDAPVLTGFWNENEPASHGTHHIDTARWADLILVAPATAHMIAKMALGLADDLLSTEILAFRGPVAIAPAMNPTMYAHPAVQENVSKLVSRGVKIIGPLAGLTSCGEEGLGRMSEPEGIVEEVASLFHAHSAGKHLLITLGPTRSPLDPVRYLTNRSSGLMGSSLVWAAIQAGYQVTAIAGPMDVPLPQGIQRYSVRTTQEMAAAVKEAWGSADIFVSTAAVLDWEIKNPASEKLKKEQGPPSFAFEKSEDILAWVGRNRTPNQKVVGFAAETANPIEYGIRKLQEKGCDGLFANDVSISGQGFESNENSGWWMTSRDDVIALEAAPKTVLARQLMEFISRL